MGQATIQRTRDAVTGLPIIRRVREARAPQVRPGDPDFALRDQLSPFKNADEALTHAAGVMIYTLYPDHPWHVEADHAQGILKIKIPQLMGATNWGVIPIRHLKNEGELRRHVMRVAGEILERYQLPRARFDSADFMRALAAIPLHKRSYHGHVPS